MRGSRTIARVPHRPSQHSLDSPVSKMASSMTMASAARCVPALARTTLALDARARTRPARWFPKRRLFLDRTGEHRTRRVSSPETRGSAWTRPRHARDERRVARPKKPRRRSRVALDRPGTPRRVRGAISGTSVSKRIISRRSDTSIAVCQVSPPRRPAAPRRATRGARAISASRRLPGAGPARRAPSRSRAHPATRPRRSPERTAQRPNTSRERQFSCRARVRLGGTTARAVWLFGDVASIFFC